MFSQIETIRNDSGKKYKRCEICIRKQLSGGMGVFITEDGTKYHTDLQCRGLKRNIISIDITQIGDKRPCSECGQGGINDK